MKKKKNEDEKEKVNGIYDGQYIHTSYIYLVNEETMLKHVN